MTDKTKERKPMSKKHKTILSVISFIVILFLCGLIIVEYSKTQATEGTYDIPINDTYIHIDNNKVDAVTELKQMLKETHDSSKTYVNLNTTITVDDSSIETDGSESEKKVLTYAKNRMIEKVSELYINHEGTFGDGFSDIPEILLNPDEVESGECVEGNTVENGEITDENYYYFNLKLPENVYPISADSSIYKTFDMGETDRILKSVKKQLSPDVKIISFNAKCIGFSIDARSDRINGQIDYINMIRNYKFELNVDFIGDLKEIQTHKISFNVSVCKNYDYTWAGVSFTADESSLLLNEEELLGISAVIGPKATSDDYEISFKSSDDSIVSVDKDGNIKGLKISSSPVTVTVTFKYCGNIYTDSCKVYVTKPVKKISISKKTISLSVGEKEKLTYQIEPDNATIKDVLWFTENEEIAVVDKNGTITPLAKGTTKIFAVSADGHYRSSCIVTVTDNSSAKDGD